MAFHSSYPKHELENAGMSCPKKIAGIVFFVLAAVSCYAQKTTRGIVMDSLTLKTLPGVHVMVKSTKRVAVTNSSGVFILNTIPTDTLVLSYVGYKTIELPLLFEEEDILIRMEEKVIILKEVTIIDDDLYTSPILRAPRTIPKKMSVSDAFSSPWEYFAKGEREKRKVVRLINENDRIKTYVKVINDPGLREEIMAANRLSETEYYSLLTKFNQQSFDVLYSTDMFEIIQELKAFYKEMSKGSPQDH